MVLLPPFRLVHKNKRIRRAEYFTLRAAARKNARCRANAAQYGVILARGAPAFQGCKCENRGLRAQTAFCPAIKGLFLCRFSAIMVIDTNGFFTKL
jgi:hypothetical protein